ncbi:MAG: hypothetical protein JSU69_10455, partial [Candidatus Zixiibacteriota bacterium]
MSKSFVAFLILGVLALLLVLRFISLESDPPLFYVGHGQAQLTDPYHLTHFARNRILFDDWDPFDYHRWDLFKASLVSGFSYIVFSVFGVSRATANLAAVLLQSGGIFFFLLGWLQFRPKRETMVTAGIILVNSTLFFYGRLPFLENGLIFLSGLAFYIFARFHGSARGQILTGFLVSLAALAGKLFGFVLLGPVILVLIYRYRRDVARPILYTLIGLILGTGLYLIVMFQGKAVVLLSYYAEQTTGMYGFPPGFVSIAGFFKMLLTYGGESGFGEYTPFLIVLTAVGILLMILSGEFLGAFRHDRIPLIFASAWLLCGILGLMPFQYRPLRYALFLYLPISAVCARALVIAADRSLKLGIQKKWLSLTMICFTLWFLFTQVWIFFSPVGKKFESGAGNLHLSFLPALVVTAVVFLLFGSKKRVSPRKIAALLMTLLCAAYAVHQGVYIYRGLSHPGTHLSRSSHQLGDLLGGDAVLTGPYSATLAIDNNLKNVIYMFGLANVEHDLFDKYPITHVTA